MARANKSNDSIVGKLIEVARNVATAVVKEKTKNMPREWVAIVASASISPNGVGNVYLNGDLTSTPISVKSKSWETVSLNDEVYLHSPTGNLSNCIILYKK